MRSRTIIAFANMKKHHRSVGLAIVLLVGIAIGVIFARPDASVPFLMGSSAQAQPAARGVRAAESKTHAWYPRTEKLAADEMFVVALGTGMPTPSSSSGSGSTISAGAKLRDWKRR